MKFILNFVKAFISTCIVAAVVNFSDATEDNRDNNPSCQVAFVKSAQYKKFFLECLKEKNIQSLYPDLKNETELLEKFMNDLHTSDAVDDKVSIICINA
jgi:hypothetical protein